jgi:hypothetical protein
MTRMCNRVVQLLAWWPWLQSWAAWGLDGLLVKLEPRGDRGRK